MIFGLTNRVVPSLALIGALGDHLSCFEWSQISDRDMLALPTQAQAPNTAVTIFDGQYIYPNASNDAVEWWWGQAIAEPEGSNPPAAFQFLFYQGSQSRKNPALLSLS